MSRYQSLEHSKREPEIGSVSYLIKEEMNLMLGTREVDSFMRKSIKPSWTGNILQNVCFPFVLIPC